MGHMLPAGELHELSSAGALEAYTSQKCAFLSVVNRAGKAEPATPLRRRCLQVSLQLLQ